MELADFLRWRIKGALTALAGLADSATPDEWTARPYPGANPIGFSMWHPAATVDWVVNRLIDGVEELRFGERWQGTAVGAMVVPFGMPPETATAIVEGSTGPEVADYLREVVDTVDRFLSRAGGLDRVPETRRNMVGYPADRTGEFEEDAEWMWDAPVWMLLGRPAMGHLFMHLGEAEAGLEARRRSN